jgi:rfaE bifunctional protein nucleotidyltransferase chain/domain
MISKKILVLTTGAYDIVHDGHPKYFQAAKEFGDVLIVGVNDDESIRKIKGEKRPILAEDIRLQVVAGFEWVDYAFIFSDDNSIADIVRPHVLVMSETSENGLDERKEQVAIIEQYGGVVKLLPPMSMIHTSDIIRKIQSLGAAFL